MLSHETMKRVKINKEIKKNIFLYGRQWNMKRAFNNAGANNSVIETFRLSNVGVCVVKKIAISLSVVQSHTHTHTHVYSISNRISHESHEHNKCHFSQSLALTAYYFGRGFLTHIWHLYRLLTLTTTVSTSCAIFHSMAHGAQVRHARPLHPLFQFSI